MAFKHDEDINMDLFVAALQDAVTKVKTEENPEVLNSLKKAYKQAVPFSLRTYVAAYLTKTLIGGSSGRDSFKRRHNYREMKGSAERESSWKERRSVSDDVRREEIKERAPKAPKVQIDEALAATVFVSIGRNRRVFPRDLIGLLAGVAGLDRERIGDIRVLANYSFVQLFAEDADKAIAALNGYDYRGRKLTVSYSKQRDSEESAAGSADESRLAEEPVASVPAGSFEPASSAETPLV